MSDEEDQHMYDNDVEGVGANGGDEEPDDVPMDEQPSNKSKAKRRAVEDDEDDEDEEDDEDDEDEDEDDEGPGRKAKKRAKVRIH